MTVDIAGALIFAFLVVLGWRSGALRQILRVVAIVAVIVGVPFLSPMVREYVFGQPGRAEPGVEVASIIISGLVLYVAVALTGWVLVRMMRWVSATLDLMDRAAGAGIGAVKAAALIYLFAVAVVFMEGPITEQYPEDELRLLDGHITEFVGDHNVLAPWQFPDLGRLHRALSVGQKVEEEGLHELVRQQGEAADFLRDETVRELLEDEQLMDWVEGDHYPMTLADPRVREVLNDESLSRKLEEVDWRKLEGRVQQQMEQ